MKTVFNHRGGKVFSRWAGVNKTNLGFNCSAGQDALIVELGVPLRWRGWLAEILCCWWASRPGNKIVT